SLLDPTPVLDDAFWPMVAAFDAAGEYYFSQAHRTLARANFVAYVRHLEDQARGERVPPGCVPSNTYWLVRGGSASDTIVGTSSLRHHLTPALEDIGGHIGYRIRPDARRLGYGTHILALTLAKARACGLDRVLLTCDTDDIGSGRIIERHGGVLASQ